MRTLMRSLIVVLAAAAPAGATVRLPTVISDHMVLQRGPQARLWGTAAPGERITIRLGDVRVTARADAKGHWSTAIGPLSAGGPFALEVSGARNTVRVQDVLVGEVWVASGQSNMEFALDGASNAAAEIAAADQPAIRHFNVTKALATSPREDVTGQWIPTTPETAATFSAVAHFFARELHARLHVPIGIIHASWGGTPAEAWMSRTALTADPEFRALLERFDATAADAGAEAAYESALAEWERGNVAVDAGNQGAGSGWARPETDASRWPAIEVPRPWERTGLNLDGAVWLRRDVEVPAAWVGKDLELTLGAIDDFDTTYWEGTEVGHTGSETPGYWTHPRRYVVPGSLVHGGRSVIAVRVFDRGGDGGFMGPGELMRMLPTLGQGEPIRLAGAWHYRIERGVGPVQPDWGSQPQPPVGQNSPTVLFNSMVAPLTPLAVRGAIWYQGEANAGRAYQYRRLFRALIRDWRRSFANPEFPFLFVQLANFMPRAALPGESEWAELREAQTLALKEPRTGMAVAIDVGEAGDIHPRNKQDVGKRLALAALSSVYGQGVEGCGPLYASSSIAAGKVRLHFTHASGLRTSDGAAPKGFAVAGADGKFVWAQAAIEGEEIVVWNPAVTAPAAVRYAWADNPEVNLVNGSDLPASPFRTDDWPGLTSPKGGPQ
jgi:sialate O-acetylesterase